MVGIGSGDGGRSLVRAAEPATLGSSGSAETQALQACSKKVYVQQQQPQQPQQPVSFWIMHGQWDKEMKG